MKRSLLLVAGILAAFFLNSSCAKTRYCNCTSVAVPAQNYKYTYDAVTSKDAKKLCDAQQTSGKTYTTDYTCEIE